jgi:hypothetical protein
MLLLMFNAPLYLLRHKNDIEMRVITQTCGAGKPLPRGCRSVLPQPHRAIDSQLQAWLHAWVHLRNRLHRARGAPTKAPKESIQVVPGVCGGVRSRTRLALSAR